jgi:hypothetical protein
MPERLEASQMLGGDEGREKMALWEMHSTDKQRGASTEARGWRHS